MLLEVTIIYFQGNINKTCLHPLFLHMVPFGISDKLSMLFPFVLFKLIVAICCTREEDMIGFKLFNGKSADGLGNDTYFGAWCTMTSSLRLLSGTYFSGSFGFVPL